jgi:transcriptional regulator with XRE-family HTH domain
MIDQKALNIQIGANLRAARHNAGMTQEQLGDVIGVQFQQIQKYETGMNRISAPRLVVACLALRCDYMAILPALTVSDKEVAA